MDSAEQTPEQPQIYLVTPPSFELGQFPGQLARVLDEIEVACVRLDLVSRDEDTLSRAADALREVTHARDIALVISDHQILAERLGLSKEDYMTTFQSRFGKEEWLKPYTDETLKSLPGKGVKSIDVFCPGFSSDCLETIEEIDEENREYFMEAGGEGFSYITALNATPGHIEALVKLIEENLEGWQVPKNEPEALAARQQRAAEQKEAIYPGRDL